MTGGAGYIGTHTCVELLAAGYEVVVLDNLANSSEKALQRVEQISEKSLSFVLGSVNDSAILDQVFEEFSIDAVIHFAGLKAVGESVELPLSYYTTNVEGTLSLCRAMERHDCQRLIFSSSATVYGEPEFLPLNETARTGAENPYGRTKLMVEEILRDIATSPKTQAKFTLLRYFNPIGAHPSGLIGEDPQGIPNNLLPFVARVAVGKLDQLRVWGNDYDTRDGTGERDYIHVIDLAKGHVAAVNDLMRDDCEPDCYCYNLGTGNGSTVLEVVAAFEAASGVHIPYEICDRRPGDVASNYADASLAQQKLGWTAQFSLQDMVSHTWHWQSKNPNGYAE